MIAPINGEVIIYRQDRLDFGALQQRINRRPATTARLAREYPAHLIAFDLLHRAGTDLLRQPYGGAGRVQQADDLTAQRQPNHSVPFPWPLAISWLDGQNACC
ncbi:hypothetical protein QNO09_38050 [Streptomyces sp. 378]|uniref:ATP-dependent DNA ligase n=1 Tax=Streptomyces sp. 378 TaxID=3049412 RepID=UPI0024C2F58E|nr:hypothetical protein [Streptomyces sp. 378]MDK1348956.1 hypothetical protein [Streptomyces sp. 378]